MGGEQMKKQIGMILLAGVLSSLPVLAKEFSAEDIENDLNSTKSDWTSINKKVFELSNHCISCHAVWKNNLI
jgi:hypothetical protein